MKKTVILMSAVLFLLLSLHLSAFAEETPAPARKSEWGFGLRGAYHPGETNMEDILFDAQMMGALDTDERGMYVSYGGEIFYETPFSQEYAFSGGVKVGLEYSPFSKLTFRDASFNRYNLEINALHIPVSIYLKYNLLKKLNIYGGWGVTFLNAYFVDGPVKESKSSCFPHFVFGAEYRLAKHIGLGADFRHNSASQIEDSNDFLVLDVSGLSGGLLVRVYF